MKLLLINLSLRPESEKRIVPIGLGYIATVIDRAGIKFDLLDMDLYKYPMSFLEEEVNWGRYDTVAFGCIVTGYRYVKQAVDIIKRANPEIKIIVGNSVASSIPLQDYVPVDYVVIGEGDKTVLDILNAQPTKKTVLDINSLPLINWDLFNIEEYIRYYNKFNVPEPHPIPFDNLRVMPVNSARGCVHRCSFCYQEFHDYPYRYRSVESLSKEVHQLIDKYKVNYITFYDDLTIFSTKRTIEFCDIMEGKNIHWTACCRGDLYSMKDITLLRRLRDCGCVALGYSLESADEDILKLMNKHLSLEQFSKQKRVLDMVGIATVTSIIIGYPDETEDTLKKTFDFCYNNNMYPSVGYLQPLPGTPVYDYAVKNGHIPNKEEYWLQMGDRQDLHINLTRIPSDRMEELVKYHLTRLRDKLHLPLSDDNLIKTRMVRGR